MNEKFNKNAKVEKFTTMLGIADCLIVIDPLEIFSGPERFTGQGLWTTVFFFLEDCAYSCYLDICTFLASRDECPGS